MKTSTAPTPAQRREQFLALAAQAYDELETWYTSIRTPRSPRAAREVRGRGLEILINQRRRTADITPPVCPTCGRPMRLKGRRAKPVNGLEGQSRIERSHSVRPNGCGQTVLPPGPGAAPERRPME